MSTFPRIIYRTTAPSALDIAPQGTICKDSHDQYYIQISAHDTMIWYECSTLADAERIKENLQSD